jgi:hypothetical protein
MHRGGQLPVSDQKTNRGLELSRILLEELWHGSFERGESGVDLDDLIGADRVCGIHVGTVLGPLGAALTAMEDAGVGARAVEIDDRLGQLATARTTAAIPGLHPRVLHRTYPLKRESA